jgi:MoxR-like ATPase
MEAVNEIEQRIQGARRGFDELREEMARVIVGHEELVEQVFVALVCGGHCLIEGVPGLGKTLMVRSLGEILSLSFSRIQFTPDLMPADITGTNVLTDDPSGRKVFEFQRGPVFAHIVLADEINRATPKTQSALLEAMQEQSVTVGGKAYRLESPFMVLATQNPIEMEGTYPLPEAQVDRFFFKLLLQYPSREELGRIADLTTAAPPRRCVKFWTRSDHGCASGCARFRSPGGQDYAVRLIWHAPANEQAAQRRSAPLVLYGSSRAVAGLIWRQAARFVGRPNVVQRILMLAPSLRHR